MTTWVPDSNDYAASLARDAEAERVWRTCPRCHGAGEVSWNPSRSNDPQCVETARCAHCGGEGSLELCHRCGGRGAAPAGEDSCDRCWGSGTELP